MQFFPILRAGCFFSGSSFSEWNFSPNSGKASASRCSIPPSISSAFCGLLSRNDVKVLFVRFFRFGVKSVSIGAPERGESIKVGRDSDFSCLGACSSVLGEIGETGPPGNITGILANCALIPNAATLAGFAGGLAGGLAEGLMGGWSSFDGSFRSGILGLLVTAAAFIGEASIIVVGRRFFLIAAIGDTGADAAPPSFLRIGFGDAFSLTCVGSKFKPPPRDVIGRAADRAAALVGPGNLGIGSELGAAGSSVVIIFGLSSYVGFARPTTRFPLVGGLLPGLPDTLDFVTWFVNTLASL
mmetsp:Transcript_15231/g.19314  ORF Transcript_15231/g.19314 Transcript_15231/m.19314 type:complete len:299 (-) Transcript_15231:413-1309(-)